MKKRDLQEVLRKTPVMRAVFKLNRVPEWMKRLDPATFEPVQQGELFCASVHDTYGDTFLRVKDTSYYSISSRFLTFVGYQDVSERN